MEDFMKEHRKTVAKRQQKIKKVKEGLSDCSYDELMGYVIFYMIKCGEIE